MRAAATPLFPSTPGSVAARTMVSHASYRSSGHVSTRQQLAAMTPAARALVATVAAEAAGRRSSSSGGGAASALSAASPAISLRKA
ncbi:hypothetical protein EON67_05385 [archaeon]|nr:MAG: hypothetical protein EON67_05385 [archaeon]